jgi:hypothetical protein
VQCRIRPHYVLVAHRATTTLAGTTERHATSQTSHHPPATKHSGPYAVERAGAVLALHRGSVQNPGKLQGAVTARGTEHCTSQATVQLRADGRRREFISGVVEVLPGSSAGGGWRAVRQRFHCAASPHSPGSFGLCQMSKPATIHLGIRTRQWSALLPETFTYNPPPGGPLPPGKAFL